MARSATELESGKFKTEAYALRIRTKVSEMPDYMKDDALRQGMIAYQTFETADEMAKDIKEFFDSKYYPFWQCIVGIDFGNFVTHVTGCFIMFHINNYSFAVFKTQNGRPWNLNDPKNSTKWINKSTMFIAAPKRKSKKQVTKKIYRIEETEEGEEEGATKKSDPIEGQCEEKAMTAIDIESKGNVEVVLKKSVSFQCELEEKDCEEEVEEEEEVEIMI